MNLILGFNIHIIILISRQQLVFQLLPFLFLPLISQISTEKYLGKSVYLWENVFLKLL